jgi:hypothetical protein
MPAPALLQARGVPTGPPVARPRPGPAGCAIPPRHSSTDHRTGLVRGDVLPPPTASPSRTPDSASGQDRSARYLPEPQLIAQLLAELEPKEAGQELPAKRRVEYQASGGADPSITICDHRREPFRSIVSGRRGVPARFGDILPLNFRYFSSPVSSCRACLHGKFGEPNPGPVDVKGALPM